jgi:hypothetical protein
MMDWQRQDAVPIPNPLLLESWTVRAFCLSFAVAIYFAAPALAADASQSDLQVVQEFVSIHCLDCHSSDDAEANFDLEAFDFSAEAFSKVDFKTDGWEKVLRRIDTRQMPPPATARPDEDEYVSVAQSLTAVLEKRASDFPRPGKEAAIRRMTRLEYQNAIRDLLGIHIDAGDYLPKDESSHGFDNITSGELSPTHLNRYLSAAQSIARAAVGGIGNGPSGVTIRLPADRSQETHVAGLPFGTRGGTVFEHAFPQTGDYEFELKLTRDRDEKVEGLFRKHQIDVLIDRDRRHQFTVVPPQGEGNWEARDHTHVDSHLRIRLRIEAGVHSVGITFPSTSSSLTEGKRQPFDASFNRHRHPRRSPATYQISIVGPFAAVDPVRESVDRGSAEAKLAKIMQKAYRRPVTEDDIELIMEFYDEGFEKGFESALSAILVNPNFLFRIEETSDESNTGVVQISDIELASRLSFFVWSSLPDETLLQLAQQKLLHQDDVLRQQAQRMLKDPRSESLVENFAAQWLYLRNLDSITPDLRLFPDFDDNLRQAFAQETKRLFKEVLNEDLSVMKLIASDHTFLNDRLAKHYGISGVTGSEFRRVALPPDSRRGGILRHGSVLMVTSYATRTSPTIRGNWVLENIFGTPAPPPPPDIPNLGEKSTLKATTVRQRLALHRENPACASCHDLIDPVGFALENYDAVGRWRQFEETLAIDSRGALPDGTDVQSVEDLERGILDRPSVFVQTLTEKLMTFALGRSVEPEDGPAIRRIVEQSAGENYRFSSIVSGIILSEPFRFRSTESP